MSFKELVYVPEQGKFKPIDELNGIKTLNISGTELRQLLYEGMRSQIGFIPEVLEELRKTLPPLSKRGFTIFFTGLSGSGKSTIANAVLTKLMEMGGRLLLCLMEI